MSQFVQSIFLNQRHLPRHWPQSGLLKRHSAYFPTVRDRLTFRSQHIETAPIEASKAETLFYEGDVTVPKTFKTDQTLQASGNIILEEGCHVGGLIAEGQIQATGATIHGNILAKKQIKLSHCKISGNITSETDTILDHCNSIGDITCYGRLKATKLTHQGPIFVPSGKLRIRNSNISGILAAKGPVTSIGSTITGDILANDSIRMDTTTLHGQAFSSQGNIVAKTCIVELSLFAKGRLTAQNCHVQQDATAHLGIDWKNGKVGQNLHSIQGTVKLIGGKARNVSAHQEVHLNDATVYSGVTAQSTIDIIKSHIYKTTHSKTGSIIATHSTLGELHSQKNILLNHVTLNGKVKTDIGTIQAHHAIGNNCDIEAITTLTLVGCRNIRKLKAYADLTLTDSQITQETTVVGSHSNIQISNSTLTGHFSYPTSATLKITNSEIPLKTPIVSSALKSTCVS